MDGAVLGIDLGTNSIGWALIDENAGKIVAAGVRVFPEGVDRDQQGGELSKNETRRTKRGSRRQTARRARRKRRLRELLISEGLFPEDSTLQDGLFQLDPYELRAKAIQEEITLYEVGRVLLHLNQRRGFKSNRKSDREREKETSKMLEEISQLQAEIGANGHRTLGEHFHELRKNPHESVRGKHTRREMYENELAAIWSKQKEYHLDVLTDQLYQRVRDVLFYQRPLHPVRRLIGHCELEPKHPRCPRADRAAQRFRLLQEVNNLRMLDMTTGEDRPLTDQERQEIIAYLSKSRTFDQIRKKLGLFESCKFNFERGERDKMLGMETDAALANRNLFGKRWYDLPEPMKDRIVDALLHEEDEERLISTAVKEWEVDREVAELLSGVNLPKGYMSYSREAIEKLLPHLVKGLPLMSTDDSPSALMEAGYLRPDQRKLKTRKYLPKPPDLLNPIVMQALHEVRRLVNAIIREYGKPGRIHIELAREVKGSLQRRRETTIRNREREQERERAAAEIQEMGYNKSREAIDRYLLWKEQEQMCVYSGRSISLAQLFGGEVEIDHILPRGRSLDNSFANRVLSFRFANAEKGDRTPYEWLAESDPDRYDEVMQRVRRLPYGKRRKFAQKNVELDGFIERQLRDTADISQMVAKYVRCLGSDVICTKGQVTAELRQLWGLNTVLNPVWEGHKYRDDHRHHAIDAIVVALTSRSRLQRLARSRKRSATPDERQYPPPWEGFRNEVDEVINGIYVSHRVQRKVKGPLHEETIYGPTPDAGKFVYRKRLEDLTPKMVSQIRDPAIREIVVQRLREHGIEPGKGGKIPKSVWEEPLTMPSGVPIKKVRLIKMDKSIQPIRGGTACVKSGSNHHICVFEYDEGQSVRKDAVFVSMLEAAQRARDKEPVVRRTHPGIPEARFCFSLGANEMLLMEHEGKEDLYRYETAASTTQQMWFRHHTFAGKSADKRGQITKRPSTLNARKVIIDRLGRLRWAND